MLKAEYDEKELIVDILTRSFDANQSVNYIVPQDKNRFQRVRALMDYSFEVCYSFGDVFIAEDKRACALVLFPDQRKVSFQSILLDLKLIFSCIGMANIPKAMSRESKIKELQSMGIMYYLWFIGVDPEFQRQGVGTKLLNEVLADGNAKNRPICLETSTLGNLTWYKKAGFEIYNELDLGYRLYFLKRESGLK